VPIGSVAPVRRRKLTNNSGRHNALAHNFHDNETFAHLSSRCYLAARVAGSRSRGRRYVTESEYQELIERVLPCPALVSGTDSSQLCLRIVPPGHRLEERELLVVLRARGKELELELIQPEPALAHSAVKAKTAQPEHWMETMEIHLRRWRTSDSKLIEQILGKSWRNTGLRVMPPEVWLTDPTTYYLRAQSMAGTVAIAISGPGSEATRQLSAFLTWAERVRTRAQAMLKERGTLKENTRDAGFGSFDFEVDAVRGSGL